MNESTVERNRREKFRSLWLETNDRRFRQKMRNAATRCRRAKAREQAYKNKSQRYLFIS